MNDHMTKERQLPIGTTVRSLENGLIWTIAEARKTNNQFGYGVYLYLFKEKHGLHHGYACYRRHLEVICEHESHKRQYEENTLCMSNPPQIAWKCSCGYGYGYEPVNSSVGTSRLLFQSDELPESLPPLITSPMPIEDITFNKKPYIEVVGAVIVNDYSSPKKILCAKRSNEMGHGGYWEFAGGRVEENETHSHALWREIKEEMGFDITVLEKIMTHEHDYGDKIVNLSTYKCIPFSGYPHSIEHEELRWVELHNLMLLRWAEADIPTVKEIMYKW
jgi:8-oxo-dGTP diphosphatase